MNFNKLLDKCISFISNFLEDYYTYSKRPKNITFNSIKSSTNAINAIIVQGGLLEKDDFTFQTLKLYKKNFQDNTIIIYSGWENLNYDLQISIEKIGVIVLKNSFPINSGHKNINYQIASTKAAIELCENLNVKYVAKTRSDQRFYHENWFYSLKEMLNSFPLINNNGVQKNRLIALSINTFKDRLYGVSDMFMMGNIEDMKLYWNVEFDKRKKIQLSSSKPFLDYSKQKMCETYFNVNFLEKIKHNIKWTYADSLQCYRDYFIILDKDSMDMLWPKYTWSENRWSDYKTNRENYHEITFFDWILLQK